MFGPLRVHWLLLLLKSVTELISRYPPGSQAFFICPLLTWMRFLLLPVPI